MLEMKFVKEIREASLISKTKIQSRHWDETYVAKLDNLKALLIYK